MYRNFVVVSYVVASIHRAVYQIHISLRGIEPLIWRRIQLWGDMKLPRSTAYSSFCFNGRTATFMNS